jgi:hypothetical protein
MIEQFYNFLSKDHLSLALLIVSWLISTIFMFRSIKEKSDGTVSVKFLLQQMALVIIIGVFFAVSFFRFKEIIGW